MTHIPKTDEQKKREKLMNLIDLVKYLENAEEEEGGNA